MAKNFEGVKFDYFTISNARAPMDGFNVYGWKPAPRNSVLAGRGPLKHFIENYPTLKAAKAAYPKADMSNVWMEPVVNLRDLPGEDDPVPGGMYPDDIGNERKL